MQDNCMGLENTSSEGYWLNTRGMGFDQMLFHYHPIHADLSIQ